VLEGVPAIAWQILVGLAVIGLLVVVPYFVLT